MEPNDHIVATARRLRVVAWYLGGGLLVLAAAATSWLWFERTRTLEDAERSARVLTRVLEEQTARSVEAVDLTLAGIMDALRLNPALPVHDPAFEDTMRDRLRSLPQVRALFVIGPDGFIIQDTDHPYTPRVSLADRDYFAAHVADQGLGLRIGRPLISRSVGVWFVSATRRMDRPDGSFGGIAVAAVEPRYFERFYRDLDVGRRGSIALYRSDGILITRFPYDDDIVGQDHSDLDLFRKHLAEGDDGSYRAISVIDGAPRILSYRRVANFPLVVAIGLEERDVLAGWWRTATATATAFAIVAALSVILALLWARRQTERARALQHRLQHQKLEALGRMTGGIAHDFNNLMTVVGGGLALMRRRVSDPEVKRIADMTAEALDRGTKLTQQLLAFARRQKLEIVASDPNEMIRNVGALLQNAAGQKARIQFELGPDVPACLTDHAQFDSALLNLVVNARDAMPSGGTIRIATRRCDEGDAKRMGSLKPGPYARVTVTDTGGGMAPDIARRALDPFFTTKGEQGTGLGLSQVYGFVRQVGGDMKIESGIGRGTTVHLFFPAAAAGHGSSPAGGRRRIVNAAPAAAGTEAD